MSEGDQKIPLEKLGTAVDKLCTAAALYLEQQQKESKSRTRRWQFLMGLGLVYVTVSLGALFVDQGPKLTENYAAAVRVDGEIGTGKMASAGILGLPLEQAFEDAKAQCVAIIINSPGGMVAQSQLIHDEILKLRAKHNKKVVAIGEDYMASGGYLIASAAQTIYAPSTGIVGSIGVILPGYDLTELGEKYGVRDRTYTAGGLKDPFNPLVKPSDEAKAKAQEILGELHQEFIRIVKTSRGDRIKAADRDVFSGAYWTGRHAAALGLLDGNLDIEAALAQDCGADSIKLYEPQLGLGNLMSLLKLL